ncbi:MAG: hypothetical protein WA705_30450 [Candidatus Ozemobacteraceae bacterium]
MNLLPGNRSRNRGFILLHVLVVGSLLLFLGLIFFFFVNQQHTNIHILANAEMAHFLAEAGINSTMAAVWGSGSSSIRILLSHPSPLSDISLLPCLPETWNQELARLARNVDKTASIRVKVGLVGFRQTETDPGLWVDPVAKTGRLTIESRGEYRGFQRTLTVSKNVRVANALPPVVSKFTLHVQDAAQGKEGCLNTVRNGIRGSVLAGPRPIVCFNHNTPENAIEPKSGSEIQSAEALSSIDERRGWIWLGGKKVRLNLTAGFGALGELFHFSSPQIGNTNIALSFKLSPNLLPPVFFSPVTLYWDLVEIDPMRQVPYQLNQGFILQGFYDKSDNPGLEAMYGSGILSHVEQKNFGNKSSLFHLFGDARKGFQSKTRILGKVVAAFPLFSNLEITPRESDVQSIFQRQNPAPVYLLPSMSESDFDPTRLVREFHSRQIGGPVLTVQDLTENFADYRRIMSRIVEIPYQNTLNFIETTSLGKASTQVPSEENTPLGSDGLNLTLKRENEIIYRGPLDASNLMKVVENRVQKQVVSISEFWDRFYIPARNLLDVNQIVRIQNPQHLDLVFPPREYQPPLIVSGGGMIILEEGNLILRGVKILSPNDSLSIILKNGTNVLFENSLPNHVNIVAPKAKLNAIERFDLCGTLAVSAIEQKGEFPGGTINYRESQDPTQSSHLKFSKVKIDTWDTSWHE